MIVLWVFWMNIFKGQLFCWHRLRVHILVSHRRGDAFFFSARLLGCQNGQPSGQARHAMCKSKLRWSLMCIDTSYHTSNKNSLYPIPPYWVAGCWRNAIKKRNQLYHMPQRNHQKAFACAFMICISVEFSGKIASLTHVLLIPKARISHVRTRSTFWLE